MSLALGAAVAKAGEIAYGDAEKNKAEAEALNVRLGEMCEAYGHSVVGEFPEEYFK